MSGATSSTLGSAELAELRRVADEARRVADGLRAGDTGPARNYATMAACVNVIQSLANRHVLARPVVGSAKPAKGPPAGPSLSARGEERLVVLSQPARTNSFVDTYLSVNQVLLDSFRDILTEATGRLLSQDDDEASAVPRDDVVFEQISHLWARFKRLRRWMLSVYRYLSENYLVVEGKPPLDGLAEEVFYSAFRDRSVPYFRHLRGVVAKEREGNCLNTEPVVQAGELLEPLSRIAAAAPMIESQHFVPLVSDTVTFYAKRWKASAPTLEQCAAAVDAERERAARLLPSTGQLAKLIGAVEGVVLELQPPARRFAELLRDWELEDMGRLIALVNRHSDIASLDDLAEEWKSRCEQEGQDIAKRFTSVEDVDSAARGYITEFVAMLEKHTQALDVVDRQLRQRFSSAVRSAFETSFNVGLAAQQPAGSVSAGSQQRASSTSGSGQPVRKTSAEVLAQYFDWFIRIGAEFDSREQDVLQKVARLIPYVADRDTFQESYRGFLARRVLTPNVFSETRERRALDQFRQLGMTSSRFERMITDRRRSNEETDAFLQSDEEANGGKSQPPFEMGYLILTQGIWPSLPQGPAVALPAVVTASMDRFAAWFQARDTRKRINWVHPQAAIVMSARFRFGDKDVTATAVQALVLLEFNKESADGCWTSAQVQKATGLPANDVTQAMVLCCQARLLKRSDDPTPASVSTGTAPLAGLPPLQTSTTVRVNTEYSSAAGVVRLAGMAVKPGAAAAASTKSEIRNLALDAHIVAALKQHGTLTHDDLVAEVIDRARPRFATDAASVVARIPKLVTKDYLEPVDDENTAYRFQA